jgi:tight adherence protein B
MRGWLPPAAVSVLTAMAAWCLRRWLREARANRTRLGGAGAGQGGPIRRRRFAFAVRWKPVVKAGAALVGGMVGWLSAGPMGFVIGAILGGLTPALRSRARTRGTAQLLESQLADLAESMSLGLRSGLSVILALEFAGAEATPPIREHLVRLLEEHRLGQSFEAALGRFGDAVGTDDARLFVLVTTIHAKSGGDLATALDDVARTVRHRNSVRRELRAASAQGRISGLIMGALPLAFFFVLSITSHDRLGPVLRSGAGMTMVCVGLLMEGGAYLWIRRLLRVEA